jgi:hypothetical protein
MKAWEVTVSKNIGPTERCIVIANTVDVALKRSCHWTIKCGPLEQFTFKVRMIEKGRTWRDVINRLEPRGMRTQTWQEQRNMGHRLNGEPEEIFNY